MAFSDSLSSRFTITVGEDCQLYRKTTKDQTHDLWAMTKSLHDSYESLGLGNLTADLY